MLGIRNQNGDYMNFFTKKLKEPTLSDYTRIKGKVTSLVTHSLAMQKSRNIIEGKTDQYWLVSYACNKRTFTKVHTGNLVDAITWFTTLQHNCTPIASWEITEEQYISIFVKNGIIDQLKIEGFKPTHLIN
jgi:hypothetical protein